MALVLRKIFEGYHYFFYEAIGTHGIELHKKNNFRIPDHRSENWFFLETPPLAIISILTAYVIMVKKGPSWMEQRKPFDLKNIMMVYNLIQVIINAVLGVDAAYFFFVKNSFSWECQDVNFSADEKGMQELKYTYIYLLIKILDLLDTVSYVKKISKLQIFLHFSYLSC